MKEINIFLSYCQKNSEVADNIYNYFKRNKNIELHRDIIDIKPWSSIKEYMQSINNMEYTILLISDEYLKSSNCMYEVLEVMRDRNYKDKIFPAVINSNIYNPINRIEYIHYWEKQFEELDKKLKIINPQNWGSLNKDLKRYQDISSNIADFLDVVSDMNNPNIEDVSVQIEEKLNINGFLKNNQVKNNNDLFTTLGIQKSKFSSEPTDLEMNRFVRRSFEEILILLSRLCKQYENENSGVQIEIDQVDKRTVIYQFYKNGDLVKGLKLFLSDIFAKHDNIGIVDCTLSFFGSNTTWDGMYDAKFIDGELKLYATMSLMSVQAPMTIEDVVTHIWKNYIQIYLDR